MDVIDFDEVLEGKEVVRRFPSSLEVINELFGEEAYNTDIIFAIYGMPEMGKSLFLTQEAVWFNCHGWNVLYVDTEGSALEFMKKWVPVLEARFGKRTGKLILKRVHGVTKLLEFFGVKAEIARKKGKLEFRMIEYMDDCEAEETIRKIGIDVVIVDSLSAPFRDISSEQQNYPVRADAMAVLFTRLFTMMEKYNVAVIVSNHATTNPANPYDIKASMRGGLVVKHNCKRVLYLDRREKQDVSSYRKFWLVRAEDIEDWSRTAVAKITDVGYIDVKDESEIEKVLTNAEKKRVRE